MAFLTSKPAPRPDSFRRLPSASSPLLHPPSSTRLYFDSEERDPTHYLFRYPAKFHPPAVRTLLKRFSAPGDRVLDPFCGSGTSLIEALLLDRQAIGTDVDPLAVFIARTKAHRYDLPKLRRTSDRLLHELTRHRRSADEYKHRQHADLSDRSFRDELETRSLSVPAIPNLYHWFRRYVIVDLATIKTAILQCQAPQTHRDFLMLCFGSILRNTSNADPVPVSGLEVTSHMKARDAAGRTIDPFGAFAKALNRAINSIASYLARMPRGGSVRVAWADATQLTQFVRPPFDVVVTSPPYHNAVDYYRRHQLEMYWLDLVTTHNDRLQLLPRYIGRPRVPKSHHLLSDTSPQGPLTAHWEKRLRRTSELRANAFRHYTISMQRTFRELAQLLPSTNLAVFVVGKSSWNGEEIPTTTLFEEFGRESFRLSESLWYPVRNRYMSYARRNGANIDREHVLVMQRR